MKNSGIAWTDHTFSPWHGCAKVSPACTNCYAETHDARFAGKTPHWGVNAPRRFFGDKHWNEPLNWNREAEKSGVRKRVFCASMADVFELRDDLRAPRARLFDTIAKTPNLDWLLLTKRPENFATMLPWHTKMTPWSNVWLGTTVENQEWANVRLPFLLSARAVVHFISVEPMLGRIELPRYDQSMGRSHSPIDWVICGCESGPGARPQKLDDVRDLRDQCAEIGAAFFLKQLEEDRGDSPIQIRTPRTTSTTMNATDGGGAWRKGPRKTLIEQPYLDGVQHVELPSVRA